MDLNHKVILIVGGTSGLGESAARKFLQYGAKVAVMGRSESKIQSASQWLGDDGVAIQSDAADPVQVDRAFSEVRERFGDLHGLYHVAGGSGRRFGDGPMHEITDEGWLQTLRLNLDSVFYSNRAALRVFLEQGQGGSILNCGSVLGFSPSPHFFSTHAYATSKSAMVGMVKSSAAYYAKEGIRVNLLCPGLIATPMSERAQTNQPIMDFIRTKQPLDGGRIGVPQDLDDAAALLLSDGARFITGQVLSVDGGWTVSEGQS